MKKKILVLPLWAMLSAPCLHGNGIKLRETERAAGALGMQLQYVDTRSAKDIGLHSREASKERADAVFVLGFPGTLSERTMLAQHAVKTRLPAI